MGKARLEVDGKSFEFPVVEGSEHERGVDISALRNQTGLVTLDPAFGNTGSCRSAITFIDGDRGILRYRGYPIEEIAASARFTEVCYLLVYGERPTAAQYAKWKDSLTHHTMLHEDMKKFFEGYPPSAHPMAIMAAMMASLSSFYPGHDDEKSLDLNIVRLLAKSKTIAAFAYKKSIGQPFVYPQNNLSWPANFLRMMFAVPAEPYEVDPVLEEALNLLLILHADHEQNCSTSTARMVTSSGANLFASLSAAICALWGPRHGGANEEVLEMLGTIRALGGNCKSFVEKVKRKEEGVKLMGFGHRVYKSFDPRAKLLKAAADRILAKLGIDDPLLELAKQLEETALSDSYFIERKLYPNVDFYSGLIYRAMGIPTNMFTVMFVLGRIPGWIAHCRELRADPDNRIARPRQIYTGPTVRKWEGSPV
ncbi:MAG: citrate synthase [Planctomycetota bacterium]